MQSYLGGQDITLTIPLVTEDAPSVAIVANSVEYRVIDQNETELVARVASGTFIPGDSTVTVVIPALTNALTLARELRVVEVYAITDTGVFLISVPYIIEAEAVLQVGVNSFQSYPSAVLVGFELPAMDAWNAATKPERINALIAAWRNFARLSLRYVDASFGGVEMTRVVLPSDISYYDITQLTQTQYLALPEEMRKAVARAQLFEADFLLGGNAVDEIRRQGVMSSTVGESSQFFRTSKPYEGPLCKRALKELTRYIVGGMKVGRA